MRFWRAAQREVMEELRMKCPTWHHLGRYRTDVNKGMGWVSSFLAMDCSPLVDTEKRSDVDSATSSVRGPDYEDQKLVI